jgi:hypothetical protein
MPTYLDDMQKSAPKITVKIGSKLDVTYLVAHTTAPENYDAFGSFTLVDGIDVPPRAASGRIVLIQERHFKWHVQRYASGLYHTIPGDPELQAEYERRVVEKFFGKGEL